MKIIDAPQGSSEWLAVRARHFTASEAPAMLGLSKYKTRQELLREKATGLAEEVDANKQRLFDRGHEAEAAARPLAEAYLQEDLFPATGAAEIDGLPLLASFDGLNMEETLVWENKLASDAVEAMIDTGDLSGAYWPQCEQQLLVSGASRVLFTACDGEKITAQLWYESKPERRAQLIAGWKQFAEDLANYQHVEAAPVAVAAPINELPALMVEITGSVTASNLEQWRDVVTARIAGINTNLQTDNDFADADAMVKFLDDGEKRIDLVKAQAQANAADIDRVFRALDEIKASMRAKRLELDKLVSKRKESIKVEIMQAGKDEIAKHIAMLDKRIGKGHILIPQADFATAIKGKRNLESMRGAVADLVAAKKIEANALADKIDINLNRYADIAAGHEFLFSDLSGLLLKDADAFEAIILQRINQHAESERKRLEAEREKIRAEEEAKATAKAKAEQEEAERQRNATSTARAADRVGAMISGSPEPAAQPAAVAVMQATPTATVVAAAQDNGRHIRLGEINALLGFTVTAEFLAGLGFVATQDKNARLYRECDLPAIYQAIIDHVNSVWARMQPGKLKAAA